MKMHLYVITRGHKPRVDQLISDLQAQYFPYERKKTKTNMVAMGVRPIQIWELVMPKESLNCVANTLWPDTVNPWDNCQKWVKPSLTALRLALGAKKIPDMDPNIPRRIVDNNDIGIYPVGIKEDKINEDGEEAL
jgi:hypothetical protein